MQRQRLLCRQVASSFAEANSGRWLVGWLVGRLVGW